MPRESVSYVDLLNVYVFRSLGLLNYICLCGQAIICNKLLSNLILSKPILWGQVSDANEYV